MSSSRSEVVTQSGCSSVRSSPFFSFSVLGVFSSPSVSMGVQESLNGVLFEVSRVFQKSYKDVQGSFRGV